MGQPELTVMDIFRKQLIETTYTRLSLEINYGACTL